MFLYNLANLNNVPRGLLSAAILAFVVWAFSLANSQPHPFILPSPRLFIFFAFIRYILSFIFNFWYLHSNDGHGDDDDDNQCWKPITVGGICCIYQIVHQIVFRWENLRWWYCHSIQIGGGEMVVFSGFTGIICGRNAQLIPLGW